MVSIVRRLDGVVNGDGNRQDPAEQCEDLVSGDGASAVRLAPAKWVPCRTIVSKDVEERILNLLELTAMPIRHCGRWEAMKPSM